MRHAARPVVLWLSSGQGAACDIMQRQYSCAQGQPQGSLSPERQRPAACVAIVTHHRDEQPQQMVMWQNWGQAGLAAGQRAEVQLKVQEVLGLQPATLLSRLARAVERPPRAAS